MAFSVILSHGRESRINSNMYGIYFILKKQQPLYSTCNSPKPLHPMLHDLGKSMPYDEASKDGRPGFEIKMGRLTDESSYLNH